MNNTHPAFDLQEASQAAASALVLDSPHSFRHWPTDAMACLASPEALLSSWDAYLDELWSAAAQGRAPVLSARFHRAYIDANRARDDIDPQLISGQWPGPLKPSEKSRAGMGLIRMYALPGVAMYAQPLTVAEIEQRLRRYYDPYHAQLRQLIERAQSQHGFSCHIDCHSMKSVGNAMNIDNGQRRPDVVLGDRDHSTAHPALTQFIAEQLSALGLRVQINSPYKGAELVRRYSAPEQGRHSVQIELNRALYMDEKSCEKNSNYPLLQKQLQTLVDQLLIALESDLGQLLHPTQHQFTFAQAEPESPVAVKSAWPASAAA
mgnify:CR=1 FL=1